jgi:hypothetical protein
MTSKHPNSHWLDRLQGDVVAARAGNLNGWRLWLLWVWVLLGIALVLCYVLVGAPGLLTAGLVMLFVPAALVGLLSLRARLRAPHSSDRGPER